MLRFAMFFLTVFILIGAVILLILSCIKAFKKKINIVAGAYIAIAVVNWIFLSNEIVDVDWNILIITPVTIASVILLVIGLIVSNLKKMAKEKELSTPISIVLIAVPVLFFLIPFIYEANIINRCNCLITYNYQSGWVTSEDSFIAIVNNKPVEITLDNDFFGRKSKYTDEHYEGNVYRVSVSDDGEDTIEYIRGDSDYADEAYSVYENMKTLFNSIDEMDIMYLPEEQSAIISVVYGDEYKIYGDYYCHGKDAVEINVYGHISEIAFFD